ncbi:hypothetical protein DFH08DRAFT_1073923 [Mycena albidolilacea]|uniref:Uncharacterized protein n=1 Tax=Mycena albidolilacea TaxID=1033008 RepID=A0AAD7EZQ2_9AGAR|nr:hypothetical protein DFH08DRAFT_1073923 [Mycena albidolilacea]
MNGFPAVYEEKSLDAICAQPMFLARGSIHGARFPVALVARTVLASPSPVVLATTGDFLHPRRILTAEQERKLAAASQDKELSGAWNALCTKARSDFSASLRHGPVTIAESRADYGLKMSWNAKCTDSHLSPIQPPRASLTSTPTLAAPRSDKVTGVGQQRVVDVVSVFSTGGGTTFDKARSSALEDITGTSAHDRVQWETSPTRTPDDDMGGGVQQPESKGNGRATPCRPDSLLDICGKWLPADSLAIFDGDECPCGSVLQTDCVHFLLSLTSVYLHPYLGFISRFGNTYENWTNDVLGLKRPAYYLYWLDSDSTSSTLRWDTCSAADLPFARLRL